MEKFWRKVGSRAMVGNKVFARFKHEDTRSGIRSEFLSPGVRKDFSSFRIGLDINGVKWCDMRTIVWKVYGWGLTRPD